MMEIVVRRAARSDAAAIAQLWLVSRRAAQMPPPVHDDAEVRAWVVDVLLVSCEVWVVVEESGKPVAMMALNGEWLEQLYVAPQHQRRGHGTRLVALAQAQRAALTLWTFESNRVAQRFYAAHGFTRSGPVSDDNEEHAPAIPYRWRRDS